MRTKLEKLERRRSRILRVRDQLVAIGFLDLAAAAELAGRELEPKIARLRAAASK